MNRTRFVASNCVLGLLMLISTGACCDQRKGFDRLAVESDYALLVKPSSAISRQVTMENQESGSGVGYEADVIEGFSGALPDPSPSDSARLIQIRLEQQI